MVQNLERPTLIYPDSDGKPLADNTIQFHLIKMIQGGIDALFADDSNVFVAGDLLWYPVEGSLARQAPDVMVAFGRPKGDRGSYKQWQENNLAPQVAFEILSPGNTRKEMERKFGFYEQHGIEEYYVYDPDNNVLLGWLRHETQLVKIQVMEGWISPRLGIRFETCTGELVLYEPNGERIETDLESRKQARQARQATQRAEQAMQKAEQESQARRDAITRLLGLGLNVEQVADALGFSVAEVEDYLKRS